MNVLLDSPNFHEEWAKERFSRFLDETTKVTIFPFAFHEDWVRDKKEWYDCYDKNKGKFYNELVVPFLHFGVKEDNIKLINYFENTSNELLIILNSTDVIYFNGGFPEKTVKRLIELKMIDLINSFEGIIIGWSAGATLQSEDYYISPDKYYTEYSRHRGLKHISEFAVQVHYSNENMQNESIQKFIKDTGLRVYTLERNSAVILDQGEIELIGNAKEYKE